MALALPWRHIRRDRVGPFVRRDGTVVHEVFYATAHAGDGPVDSAGGPRVALRWMTDTIVRLSYDRRIEIFERSSKAAAVTVMFDPR